MLPYIQTDMHSTRLFLWFIGVVCAVLVHSLPAELEEPLDERVSDKGTHTGPEEEHGQATKTVLSKAQRFWGKWLPGQLSCGLTSTTSAYIVNGKTAPPNAWPWLVHVYEKGCGQTCAGALIDSQWVMTAAHCFPRYQNGTAQLSDYEYRFGKNKKDYLTKEAGVQLRHISKVFFHPKFIIRSNYDIPDNDIALINLDRPVKFSRTVQPLCLPHPYDKIRTRRNCTVAGWGRLKDTILSGLGVRSTAKCQDDPNAYPKDVQQLTTKAVNHKTCKSKYKQNLGGSFEQYISRNNVCAGERGKDSCKQDSGAPLMCNKGGRWYASGLVSWGIICGYPLLDIPGVYTNVPRYTSWIKAIVKQN